MKIFIDTEFYEYQPASWRRLPGMFTGETRDTPGANAVQLISLGAVREDGAEFYAENSEFEWGDIPEDHWLQANVRPHLMTTSLDNAPGMPAAGINYVAGTPQHIAQLFHEFSLGHSARRWNPTPFKPEFWGYFCDYDWVVLCGLYGRMIDLPEEFPMYCLDLKQEMKRLGVERADLPTQTEGNHHALADARWIRDAYVYTRVAGTEEL